MIPSSKRRLRQMAHNAARQAHREILHRHPENSAYSRIMRGLKNRHEMAERRRFIDRMQRLKEQAARDRKPSMFDKIKKFVKGRGWNKSHSYGLNNHDRKS